jgi:hypothetical protein
MPTVVTSVQNKVLDAAIASVDVTNDGELVAVGLVREDGRPAVQVFRASDLEMQAEYAPDVSEGRGVAFVEDDSALMFLTHTHAGAKLWLADGPTARVVAEYPGPQARQLVRDETGARVGIIGPSFILWGVEQRCAIDTILGDAQAAGFLIQASFAARGHRVFLYGKKAGKIVLHDLARQEDVDEWDAPAPFGSYVTSSPSDRFLVAIGYNGRGVYIIDAEKRRTMADKFFDRDTPFQKHPVFLGHESVLLTWASTAWLFALPGFELSKGPAMTGTRTRAAAAARQAPVAAFGVDGNELRVVRVGS